MSGNRKGVLHIGPEWMNSPFDWHSIKIGCPGLERLHRSDFYTTKPAQRVASIFEFSRTQNTYAHTHLDGSNSAGSVEQVIVS